MNDKLPTWLGVIENRPLMRPKTRWWQRSDYLEKTLVDIQQVMAEDMFQAGIAAEQGWLQSIEPRVKVFGVGILLLAVGLTHSLPMLIIVHLFLLLTARLSDIGWTAYLKRVWLPALVFAGIVVLPAIFNWVTPGQAVVVIYQNVVWHIGSFTLPRELSITIQGIATACFVLLRASASLGLVVLLVKTTRWSILTKAIGSMGLPVVFVMVLDLTYRYLFLFLLLLSEYLLGRKSRLVAVEKTGGGLVWIGSSLAGFFRMLWQYSYEINTAMVARGFNGDNHQRLSTRLMVRDVCFLGIILIVCMSVWGGASFVKELGF
ncbi:energy-coupling factor transporter transmembrane component T family protein [Pelosinus sp. sgz500959]|uniref:energy-coupling factor transporter transmembrane component T family protein n=1 Tax=Pelosinus sp. sgz500959 TaxID=3242472 RepID=UPI00366C7C79